MSAQMNAAMNLAIEGLELSPEEAKAAQEAAPGRRGAYIGTCWSESFLHHC